MAYRYECTLPDYYGDDDWTEMEASSASAAASAFAEYLDGHDSELFQRPDVDAQDIKVRRFGSTECELYHVNFDYVKSFSVRAVQKAEST